MLASVRGDYACCEGLFDCAVLIEVPRDLRLRRARERSFRRFGARMLPGGDLYEQEEAFFRSVASRDETLSESWCRSLRCPLIRVDGAAAPQDSLRVLLEKLHQERPT